MWEVVFCEPYCCASSVKVTSIHLQGTGDVKAPRPILPSLTSLAEVAGFLCLAGLKRGSANNPVMVHHEVTWLVMGSHRS